MKQLIIIVIFSSSMFLLDSCGRKGNTEAVKSEDSTKEKTHEDVTSLTPEQMTLISVLLNKSN